jgi:hypothetical protein
LKAFQNNKYLKLLQPQKKLLQTVCQIFLIPDAINQIINVITLTHISSFIGRKFLPGCLCRVVDKGQISREAGNICRKPFVQPKFGNFYDKSLPLIRLPLIFNP